MSLCSGYPPPARTQRRLQLRATLSSTPSRSPDAAATSAWSRSDSSRGRIDWVSGSPKRQLNEHARPVVGEHEPGVEAADEGRPARSELLDHRPVHGLDELLDVRVGESRHGRVRAHPARVRPGIAVAGPLEVLRGRERQQAVAVGHHQQRDLLALEQLLDHSAAAERCGTAEARVELILCPAHEDTLAGGKPVRLDHAGRLGDRERLCRRHLRRLHDLLRERLRSLDPGGGLTRPEHSQPRMAQAIRHARDVVISSVVQSASRPSPSSARTGWQRPSDAMPGFPGAACSSESSGLRANAQASACSRPPEPTTRTLTPASLVRAFDGRLVRARAVRAVTRSSRPVESSADCRARRHPGARTCIDIHVTCGSRPISRGNPQNSR